MNIVTALAIVIGILGGLATWLFLGPMGGLGLSIWAAFIAWGSFYHCGGGEKGLQDSIAGAIWGAIMAGVALYLLPIVGNGALGAGLVVGATVLVMILGAHIPLFSAIPAAVYGYASTAAFALLNGDKAALMATNIAASPVLNIVVSMVIGAVFGYVSQKVAGSLASTAPA